jgi:hypothetical protein
MTLNCWLNVVGDFPLFCTHWPTCNWLSALHIYMYYIFEQCHNNRLSHNTQDIWHVMLSAMPVQLSNLFTLFFKHRVPEDRPDIQKRQVPLYHANSETLPTVTWNACTPLLNLEQDVSTCTLPAANHTKLSYISLLNINKTSTVLHSQFGLPRSSSRSVASKTCGYLLLI